jgi:catechol 2,3-dioxygenase-like lactoylglutathione lyase family enzyme
LTQVRSHVTRLEQAAPEPHTTTRRIDMSDTDTRTRITEVGRVMVPVADQDRAIEFYGAMLGFEKRADVPYGEGDRWVEVAPPGAATAIALVPARESEAGGVMTRIALTSDDIDADHAELRARGVDVDAELTGGDGTVPRMFFFRDQDANSLLCVARA